MEKTALKTGASVRSFLTAYIRENVKSTLHRKALQEKEKQAAAAGGGEEEGGVDIFADDESGAVPPAPIAPAAGGEQQQQQSPAPPSKTMDADTEALKAGDVTVKDVVEKLNSIRSGKSFKDDQVKAAMEQYIGSLSAPERTALFAFVKGISQIVTGEVSGQQAEDPSKHPADVEMEKSNEPHIKHLHVNVIKGQTPKAKKPGTENTAAPAPITPKKR